MSLEQKLLDRGWSFTEVEGKKLWLRLPTMVFRTFEQALEMEDLHTGEKVYNLGDEKPVEVILPKDTETKKNPDDFNWLMIDDEIVDGDLGEGC